jgi:hypothetical protein
MEYTCELCERESDTDADSDLAKAIEAGEVTGFTFVGIFCWGCGARFTKEERAELEAEAMEEV